MATVANARCSSSWSSSGYAAADASHKRPAEIHSPLHSPAMLIPVVMRDCGGFGAVSKTVDGRKVVRGFESLPLR
jgi:hypothetical protein